MVDFWTYWHEQVKGRFIISVISWSKSHIQGQFLKIEVYGINEFLNKHCEILVSCSDIERNCIQALGTDAR